MADEQQGEKKPISWIPIDTAGAENVRPVYADGLFVSRTADDVVIAFFLTKRPALTDEQIAELKILPAECVARIILPPGRPKT